MERKRMRNRRNGKWMKMLLPALAAAGLIAMSAMTALAADAKDADTAVVLEYNDYTELAGKRVGVLTGSTFDQILQETVPDAQPEYYNTPQDMREALVSGRVDGYLLDEPMARVALRETEGIGYISRMMKEESYAFVFQKNNTRLAEEFNAALKEFQADGTLEEVDARWFGTDESAKVLPEIVLTGEKGTLTLAIDATTIPFTYMNKGGYAGYDIDLLMRICEKTGYGLDIVSMTFSSVIPGVVSGKYDIATGCISITPERKEEVLFSDITYSGGVVMMVRETEPQAAGAKTGNDGAGSAADGKAVGDTFFGRLAESIEKTFLRENRWKLIADGLGVTCFISVLSAVAGSLLGFGVCMVRMSKKRWVSLWAKVFVRIMQGTPLVVILMILYYVVFTGRFSINSVAVAVIGFSMNFAAYVSEMMRTGIEAVDSGQIEAAQAMGYGKIRTFLKITFPQAARHFLPVYRGEFISLVKMTSVVGYIAIQDLTKASDIIRSRTYAAFFPLIATAIIYFLLSTLLASVLQFAERRLDPLRRNREAWKPE